MKVILLEDIKGVGKKGQMINTSDGHARNFLIPRKLGVEATDANIKNMEQQKKNEEKKRQQELEEAQALKKSLETKNIKIAVKSGEGGRIFGSVTSKEIAQAFAEQTGVQIDRKKILLNDPIKTKGSHQVDLRLHPDVVAKLNIEIE